ncbi:TetR/AcrR family transcriptional regulator [bacterium D16-51]|nr:TetR/AcrR family transcriptional regulator [bacterium D16-59]RKI58939.1 TetR/AcrR family transcriptional regulator [bacterium D16-51]
MARKTQISKKVILEAALKMLIRDGYASINIKTLSKEIGCSTQPLVWHFENMDGLRKALAEYALNYANEKIRPHAQNGAEAFAGIGMAYINLAFDEPNLFKYLYMSGECGLQTGGFDVFVNADENAAIIEQIADSLKIPKENVCCFFQNTMIYTHGLASFIASGIITSSKKEAAAMVKQTARAFLSQANK